MLESAKFVKTKNSSGEDEGQCFDEMRDLGAVVASILSPLHTVVLFRCSL